MLVYQRVNLLHLRPTFWYQRKRQFCFDFIFHSGSFLKRLWCIIEPKLRKRWGNDMPEGEILWDRYDRTMAHMASYASYGYQNCWNTQMFQMFFPSTSLPIHFPSNFFGWPRWSWLCRSAGHLWAQKCHVFSNTTLVKRHIKVSWFNYPQLSV